MPCWAHESKRKTVVLNLVWWAGQVARLTTLTHSLIITTHFKNIFDRFPHKFLWIFWKKKRKFSLLWICPGQLKIFYHCALSQVSNIQATWDWKSILDCICCLTFKNAFSILYKSLNSKLAGSFTTLSRQNIYNHHIH